jgi:hypothetical protein
MAVKLLGRLWEGVKTLRCVWDGECDHCLSPLSTKPSQGLIDVQPGTDLKKAQVFPKKSLPFALWQDTLPHQFIDSGLR